MQEPNWDDLRFILAVGRMPTFTAAARHLGVNESTVARRISRYESYMKIKLFERRMGMLQPTEECSELILRAERMESEVQAAEGLLTGTKDRAEGKVRLSAVPLIANHILVPAMPKLLTRHRDLQVEMQAGNQEFRADGMDADIALRLTRPPDANGAIVSPIGQLTYATYSAKSLAKKSTAWIAHDETLEDLPPTRPKSGEIHKQHNSKPQLWVNDAEMLLHAIKKGLGKSMLPVAVGSREIGIIRISDDAQTVARGVWLIVNAQKQDQTKIRVVVDWLKATIEQACHEQ